MNENEITFNDVPRLIAQISERMNSIEEKIDKIALQDNSPVESQWLTIQGLSEYLPNHPAEQTIYGWTSARTIPFYKGKKKIMFLKSEIDEWIMKEYVLHKSNQQLEAEAMDFINKKRYGTA